VAYQEDLPALYHDFNDSEKKQKLITCQICCIEGIPSHSKNSSICEMCFEDDFWDEMEELEKNKTDMVWAIKTIEEGLFDGYYFAVGQYLGISLYTNSVDSLGQACLCQTKADAERRIRNIQDTDSCRNEPSKKLPVFKVIQIMLSEV
jgi:hypothetical protein